jgi:hypothetical protein
MIIFIRDVVVRSEMSVDGSVMHGVYLTCPEPLSRDGLLAILESQRVCQCCSSIPSHWFAALSCSLSLSNLSHHLFFLFYRSQHLRLPLPVPLKSSDFSSCLITNRHLSLLLKMIKIFCANMIHSNTSTQCLWKLLISSSFNNKTNLC